jgi:hypothetical protein
MIKDKLKKDLILYIKSLTDTSEELDGYSFDDLLIKYLEILGISKEEIQDAITDAVIEYHKNNPDTDLEVFQIVDDVGLLEPISMIHIIDKQIADLTAKIASTEADIAFYKDQLEIDLEDLNKEDLNAFRKAEIPSDISYDRYVINNYPAKIVKYEEQIAERKATQRRIYSIPTRVSEDNYSFKK